MDKSIYYPVKIVTADSYGHLFAPFFGLHELER